MFHLLVLNTLATLARERRAHGSAHRVLHIVLLGVSTEHAYFVIADIGERISGSVGGCGGGSLNRD